MNIITVDLETEGLHHTAGLTTISFTNDFRTVTFPVNHPEMEGTEREALDKIQRIIDSADVLVAHKAHFELKHLINAGIDVSGKKVVCTKVLYWLYTGHRAKDTGLNTIAKTLLGKEKMEGYDFGKKRASEYPLKGLLEYNRGDTELTHEIYQYLIDKVDTQLVEFYSGMMYFLAELEMNGMYVDIPTLHKLRGRSEKKISILEIELLSMLEYPINIGSGPQLSCALYGGTFTIKKGGTEVVEKERKDGSIRRYTRKCDITITLKGLGFSTKGLEQTKDGHWPTNADTLLGLKGRSKRAKRWIKLYKKWNKFNAIYKKELKTVESRLIDSILYGNYHAVGTASGRISCSSDNMQNKKERRIFTSRFPEGRLVAVDFSGIQWRIATMFSKDTKMIADTIAGLDPHKVTAADTFNLKYEEITDEEKKPAKAVNFGLIFDKSAYGYANDPKLPMIRTPEEAQQFIDGAFKSRPLLKKFIERTKAIAKGKGKIIMENGRWYDFSGDFYNPRTIFNYQVQGREADIVFCASFEAWRRVKEKYGDKALLVNSVHDEIVFDCETEKIAVDVYRICNGIFKDAGTHVNRIYPDIDMSIVPIDSEGEIGVSWGLMNEIKED